MQEEAGGENGQKWTRNEENRDKSPSRLKSWYFGIQFGHGNNGHDGLLLEESGPVPLVVVVLAVDVVGVVFSATGAMGEEFVGVSLRLTPASLASAAANFD